MIKLLSNQIFNNLIQYQFEGNHHLVYIIIRRRKAFLSLQKLTLGPSCEDGATSSNGGLHNAPTKLGS